MKNIMKAIATTTKPAILIFIFMLSSQAAFAGNKVVKIKTSAICDMCKNRIELVVNNLKGVKKSMLNLKTTYVKVKYNDEIVTENDIKKALSNAGYDADEMKANPTAYEVLPGCCKKGSSCDTRK